MERCSMKNIWSPRLTSGVNIPFLRLKNWPIEDKGIEMEWVIHNPKPANFYHREIVLEDKELKNL